MKWLLVKSLFIGGLLFLLVSWAPQAQLTPLQPNIAQGGRAVAIAVHPNNPNTIVAASESGGLFLSANQGAAWSQVSGSTTFWFSDVVYVPANPIVILATAYADSRTISGGGIWRSANGGGIWSKVSLNPPVCNYIDAGNFGANDLYAESGRDRIWAGTFCGLAYSDDQGATWNFLPVATGYDNDLVLSVQAPSTNRLVIATYQGIKVSTDGGSNWTLTNPGLYGFSYVHNQIAVSPINIDHLYWAANYFSNGYRAALLRSTNNGSSWNIVFDKPGINRPPFVRTAKALSGDSTQYDIYFGDGACLLQRATADASGSSLSSWTQLSFDHCDPADLGFSTDNKTPLLLATDGGLHNTVNNGLGWNHIGGGNAGYNALQITEVTGQIHNDGLSADLYFGTQDNNIWASPNEGATWPGVLGAEGFFLNIPRDYLPANQTKLTGAVCWPCSNFISAPLLAGVAGFPNAPDDVGSPRLLKPGHYIQQTEVSGLTSSVFALTTDTGGSWTTRFGFPERTGELPKVAGFENDPVVYASIRSPGLASNGYELWEIKRISDVLGNNKPLVSNVSGFGSLGFYSTMFVNYASFGVDPNDPNYLMVSDVEDAQVKFSTDAGATWTADTTLTDLVTQSGQLKFSWWPVFTQTTTFAFDPVCSGHIAVGTQQAGIFETFDRGGKWQKVANSEMIPEVTSIYFPTDGRMIISSYGRGLWKHMYACPVKPLPKYKLVNFAEPVIYWKGARIPITQIKDPDVCPVCGYFLLKGGKVLDYKTAPGGNELLEVKINRGEIKGYTWRGEELAVPFLVTRGRIEGDLGNDEQLRKMLTGKTQIKGLFMEGSASRGLILAENDLSVDQLPRLAPLGPHIRSSVRGFRAIDDLESIVVSGFGFEPPFPIEVLLDRQALQLDIPPEFDAQGSFTFSIQPILNIGVHTIQVRQDTPGGLIEDMLSFNVTVHETD